MFKALVYCNKSTLRQSIHTTSSCLAGGRWRERRGESCNPNEYGSLVDVPDWSYPDGTPGSLSTGEIKRREHYRNLGKRALKAMEELNMAKELHKKKQASRVKNRREEYSQGLSQKFKDNNIHLCRD
ncbi:hypothetical protein LSH36_26g15097 [Paralvinella palmiformis]|uniref:Large ribosomal subunit protein mL52 n=1 Tax=Paralvinella palmiformis TaxID=53620 RepID=A0AAD9KBI5_9ANNE|nr:hypothetical protein LSH36_26g15097 [Paralvinella palmiformis]